MGPGTRLTTIAAAILIALTTLPATASAPPVKLSSSGICHDRSSPWYERTTNFRPFESLDACLAVGRLPRGHGAAAASAARGTRNSYERDLFGGWADEDRDCMNTRHELLAQLSTRAPIYSEDRCRVIRGRWNDPYTGHIFLDSRDMDIDHLVPLHWAWQRGADRWSRDKRERFANDPINLFAVDAGTNREKGARGPLEWLPPNASFRCEYILRFTRVTRLYDLDIPSSEARSLDALRTRICN